MWFGCRGGGSNRRRLTHGSDVLFRESELSGGIWEHITQSVEWYAPWELESRILSVSFVVSHCLFFRIFWLFFFGFSSLSLLSFQLRTALVCVHAVCVWSSLTAAGVGTLVTPAEGNAWRVHIVDPWRAPPNRAKTWCLRRGSAQKSGALSGPSSSALVRTTHVLTITCTLDLLRSNLFHQGFLKCRAGSPLGQSGARWSVKKL